MAVSSTGSITSSGIGSGLDVETIISKLMAIEQRPLTQLQSSATDIQTKISAFGSLTYLQTVPPSDVTVLKNRYSAFIPGASNIERVLRGMDVDTVLIAGTKTNVCCESSARDAMMLDFKVVLIEDCCAALSDDEHRAALENVIQQFGDVMTADEVLARLRHPRNETDTP